MYPTSSLIVSTYNNPKALELVLIAIANQHILPNEVIVADDGSKDETKKLIEKFQEKFPVPLVHVWQEDKGFQKSKILNKAFAIVKNNYIIQIDGDIIVNKYFVKDHLMYAEKNQFLFGSRVNIKESFLTELFIKKVTHFNFFSKGITKRFRTIRIPFFTKFLKKNHVISSKLRGCNMSFWREDIIKINGYNEAFVGWGGEDSELANRLHNAGIAGKRLKFAGIIYHIYHLEENKSNLEKNIAIQSESRNNKLSFTTDGIDKYLN
ncbi:glycosyltransferase family 2 protein [Flavobacterium sp.]|uniref:glycosyltransferase family 2 protein n=1 Tax=Flavobacterium sp. TaxID=239 RepID=UPI00286D8B82|nr:glycosyltransferase family 2 protein [Flavobacterium sp.]